MARGEFALIERYFASHRSPRQQGVALGVGDDCALLQVPAGQWLAVSMDTLVAGVHFPANGEAYHIGQRALCVTLSDLAAMGADPLWLTLGLTLPAADEAWVAAFADGFLSLADEFDVSLVGGDTTRGPLAITVQVHGSVPPGEALTRAGAQAGDGVYVTGSLGDAAAGLALLEAEAEQSAPLADVAAREYLLMRYHCPRPQLSAGRLLRGIASAAIDVSDGLLADLTHVCTQSGQRLGSPLGALLDLETLPISAALQQWGHDWQLAGMPGVDVQQQLWQWALSGGDDYRLCVTVPAAQESRLRELCERGLLEAHRIGTIDTVSGVRCQTGGRLITFSSQGYNHFGE